MIREISPYAIERRYRQFNPDGHWFDPSTMRFFNSRVSRGYVNERSQRVFFVSSEAPPHGDRRYSVRVLEPTGSIDTLGEFQQFPTRRSALAAAKRAAKRGYWVPSDSGEDAA